VHFLGPGIGIGLAGFDPAGALVLIALLAIRANRRTVTVLCVLTVFCTTLLGTVLARLLGANVHHVDLRHLRPPDRIVLVLNVVIGLALIAFAIWRMRRPPAPEKPPRTYGAGIKAAVVGGVAVGFGSILDPAFIANVALASQTQHIGMTLALGLLWAVLSHSALIVLTVCVLLGVHERPVAAFDAWWLRARPMIGTVVNWVLLALGICFLLEDVVYFASGSFVLE